MTAVITFQHRYAPSRNDHYHFRYSRLEASHRLSVLNYRTTGLVLPFGASTEPFAIRNRHLFSPDGKWLATDLANPLDSWEYVVEFVICWL
jgi:hypothetical protein